MELRERVLCAFQLVDPAAKVDAVHALWRDLPALSVDIARRFEADVAPGRPHLPALVAPQSVPRRSPHTPAGHAALMHSIAHIEFNAIALALDAVWRFDGMPPAYYADWLRVAYEESTHFSMLRDHLVSLGYDYGSFEAHDGLWSLCHATRLDIAARMALVPRTLEARGLDATPLIQAKLRTVGTPVARAAVAILDTILEEEVGHVAIGNHWYHWLCKRDALDADAFHTAVSCKYGAPRPKPPLNRTARLRAGFTPVEIDALQR